MFKALDKLSIWLDRIFSNIDVQESIRTLLQKIISFILTGSTIILAAVVVITIVPTVEQRIFPVVAEWRADNWELVEEDWNFDIYGVKSDYRANCVYLEGQTVTALVIPVGNNTAYSMDMRRVGNSRALLSKVNDKEQYFGRWEIAGEITPAAGDKVFSNFNYDCNRLAITVTSAGPFEVGINTSRKDK